MLQYIKTFILKYRIQQQIKVELSASIINEDQLWVLYDQLNTLQNQQRAIVNSFSTKTTKQAKKINYSPLMLEGLSA